MEAKFWGTQKVKDRLGDTPSDRFGIRGGKLVGTNANSENSTVCSQVVCFPAPPQLCPETAILVG
jgi:hypothetical protein